MKKNKLLAGLVLGLALFMGGCTVEVTTYAKSPSMFVMVENNKAHFFDVVYHKDTKVMYSVSDGEHNRGVLTVLVGADGKPLLWEE